MRMVEELHSSGLSLRIRRPFWGNIPGQLMSAKAPAVGVAAWSIPMEDDGFTSHVAVVWKPYDDEVILCANSQVGGKGNTPFWVAYGQTYWSTASLPALRPDSKLLAFWQVIPTRKLGDKKS